MTPSRSGPLALVGGAELGPGNESHDRVLVQAAGSGPAYVLATAAGGDRPELAVRNARRWFASLGLDVEELPAIRDEDLASPANAERAREGRFFYLVGGDPARASATLAGTLVWAAVFDAWTRGAALAGSSAGAMALGERTLTRAGRGEARAHQAGLGVVPGIAVIPHFDTFGERWVTGALAAVPGVLLVGVDERSAALWRDGEWRASGPGGVTVITRGHWRRHEPGESIATIPQPIPP